MRGIRNDREAHMLTISGTLLALGFVLMASVLIHVNNLEHDTTRLQEISLSEDRGRLLEHMNQTLQTVVPSGEPNVQYYKNISRGMQDSVQEKAARDGFFASVSLLEDPAPALYQRSSRCLGYDPDATGDGVIVGINNQTHQTGIAGAAYEVHMVDGRDTIHMNYYLRFFECTSDVIHTHALDAWADPGEVTNLSQSRKIDDMPTNLTETNRDAQIQDVSPTIDTTSFRTRHWNQPENLLEEDGLSAKHVSQESGPNYIWFNLLAPPGMRDGDTLEDPQFHVIASHNEPAAPGRDQDLLLRVYYPTDSGTPRIEKTVGPLSEGLQQFDLDLSQSPTGGANWSYDEIVDSKWELTVVGMHNPGREIFVDHFNMTGGLATLMPYRVQATLEWQEIPHIFTEHELFLRYRIEPGTPGETFQLETRDVGPGGNSTWWAITTLEETPGAWQTRTVPFSLEGAALKVLEFRFVDSAQDDTEEPVDRDTIQLDVMRVTSRIPG